MRSFCFACFVTLISSLVSAVTLKVESGKGECLFAPKEKELHITCPLAANPEMTLEDVRLEDAAIAGAAARRFVLPWVAGTKITPIVGGWNIGIASAANASSPPPASKGTANQTKELPKVQSPGTSGGAPTTPSIPALASPTMQVPAKSANASVAPAAATIKEATAPDVDAKAKAILKELKDYQVDFSIPDTPAFTVLGLSPESVTRPRTPRALAAAIKNGVDQNGKLKTGLAIEFAPLRLSDPTTLLEGYITDKQPYTSNTFSQTIQNTSISIATAQGAGGDDKSIRLGLGLSIPIIDQSDGRTDQVLKSCYQTVKERWFKADDDVDLAEDAQAKLSPNASAQQKADAAERVTRAKVALRELTLNSAAGCFKARPSVKWNATVWTVSVGNAWTSDSGNFNDRKTATRGVWTTYAGRLQDNSWLAEHGQLLLHVRALTNERVPDSKNAGKFINQDSRVAGIGFKLGSESFNATLQTSYQRLKIEGVANIDKIRKTAIGFEFKVANDMWLVATAGGESGRVNGENKSFVSAGLKFAPSNKSVLTPN